MIPGKRHFREIFANRKIPTGDNFTGDALDRNDMKRLAVGAIALAITGCSMAEGRNLSDKESTFDVVSHGMVCSNRVETTQLDCEYTIGNSLSLGIAGVGQADAGITIEKVDGLRGDYYATIGAGTTHHCVIVKPGKKTLDRDPGRLVDFAFISPKTGKTYHTWQSCRAAGRR